MTKYEALDKAFHIIKNNVDADLFGNITISMQKGVIGSIKTEKVEKLSIDVNAKR